MSARDLLQRRARFQEEARQIVDNPEGENGDLSETQERRYGECIAEMDKLDQRIGRVQDLEERERRSPTGQAPGGDTFHVSLRGYSLLRHLAHQAGLRVDAGRELEIEQEVRAQMPGGQTDGACVPLAALIPPRELRAITADASGTGDHLVATEIASEVVNVLRSQQVTARLGVRTLNGLVGNLDMPKVTTTAAADWFADGAQITEADPAFDGISFRPKHVGALSSYSRNMLLQSSPDVEAVMRQDMAASLAAALDRAVIRGAGSDEPVGILGTAGINNVVTATASVIDEDDVIDALNQIMDDDSLATGIAMSPTAATALKKLKDTDGQPLGYISGYGTGNAMWDGSLPVAITTAMPALADSATPILAGRFSDAMIGVWGPGLSVLANPYSDSAYSRGNVALRAILTADVQVRHPVSFSTVTITAA
ncbi:MAG: phage major capsid protein [Paracoccaceae bacterium]|nr:phage major capsid protein [Paracoccaceae bacterium]